MTDPSRNRQIEISDMITSSFRLILPGVVLGTLVVVGALAVVAGTHHAQADLRPVVFGCDAAKGHTCYFAVSTLHDTKVQSFTVKAGPRGEVPGLIPNIDSYMVSIDQTPPERPEDCGVRYPCKRAFVTGYNN